MITILDKDAIDKVIGRGWASREDCKVKLCEAAKNFVKINPGTASMPKNGQGSNFKIGKVNIRISKNQISFDIEDNDISFEWSRFFMSMYAFHKLYIDQSNNLLILNDKIAINYI